MKSRHMELVGDKAPPVLALKSIVDRSSNNLTDSYVAHPDDILVILHHLLPGGNLLFANFKLYQFLQSKIKAELR